MVDQPEYSGIDEAADAFMERQKQREQPDTDDEGTPGAEAEDEAEDEAEGDATDEEVDEDDESDDDADDDETDDGTSESDEESDDKYVFKVKDEETGEETGVDAEEARLGYLRQRDYTRKTQELSSERKEVTALKDELTQAKGQVAEVLEQLSMAADKELSEFVGIDWRKLEQEDPYEFEEKSRRYSALKLQHDQATEHQKELQRQYQEEFERRIQEFREEERRKLLEQAPEFDPEAGGQELQEAVLGTARERYGFTDDELQQIFDHRAVLMLRDAHKYHELKAKMEKGKLRQEKAPKHVKPGARPDPKARKTKQSERLRSRAKQTGSMEDALDFLMHSASSRR